jgi:serine/threonine protein kinase
VPSAGDRVALKRVSEDPHNPGTGMRVDALREIKLLQELHHKNVVPLLDVYKRDQAVELVFPFAPRDLKQVRRSLARSLVLHN